MQKFAQSAERKLRSGRPPHPEPKELLGDLGGRHGDRHLVDLLVGSRAPGRLTLRASCVF